MPEVCRKMGITEQTFRRRKKKYAGMGVSEVGKLRILEEENKKLKHLVADLSLDKQMLRDVLRNMKVEAWREEYNRHRPHGALGNLSPLEFIKVKELVC